MEQLFKFLSKPSVVRFHVAFSLLWARIFRRSRDYYRKLKASNERSDDGLEFNPSERQLMSYFVVYEYLCNSIMLYTMAIKFVPVDKVIKYFVEPEIPARCFLIGRYSPRFVYSEELALISNLNHLGWRLAQHFRPQEPKPLCLIFMLFSAHQKEPKAIHDTIYSYEVVYPQSRTPDLIVRVTRPNRTPLARKLLVHRFAILTIVSHASTAFYYFLLVIFIFLGVFSDLKYLDSYPNCSPELQHLKDQGKLGILSMSWTWHKLLVLPFDLLLSLMAWMDGLMSVAYAATLMYVFDYDLELYWNDLERRLHSMYHKIQRENRMKELNAQRKLRYTKSLSERDILDLQMSLADFFGQFRAAGTYCSAALTMSTIAWMSIVGLITYMTNFIQVEALPRVLTFGTCTGLAVISMNNYHLCALNRRVHRSHRMLSSIIAHDNSRFKGKFTAIQEYYARHAGAYKIFGSYPFTSSTFLTCASWSLSCFAVLQSVARQISANDMFRISGRDSANFTHV